MELDRYFEGILDKSKIPAIISRAKEDKDMAAIDLIKSYNEIKLRQKSFNK